MRHYVILYFLVTILRLSIAHEQTYINRLNSYTNHRLPLSVLTDLESRISPISKRAFMNHKPLVYTYYPKLSSIKCIRLAKLPTPIKHCKTFGNFLGAPQLYIKDDGLTGSYQNSSRLFGGNKVRKLEFILADALAHNAQAVLTFGCAGSNHLVSTSVYADKVGLRSIGIVKDQPNSETVQRNLLLHIRYNTKLIYAESVEASYYSAADAFFDEKNKTGQFPYIIPTGGSTPLGVLGYINAIFELKEQIKEGTMPEPDTIFVATGSGGTAVGLILGLQLAELKSRVVAIHVEPEEVPGQMLSVIKKLYQETISFLQERDPAIEHSFPDERFTILHGFGGEEYGLPTKEAQNAAQHLLEKEGIQLDPTYTSKGLAGMASYLQSENLDSQVILFFNTYCSDEYPDLLKSDHTNLPEPLQGYFKEALNYHAG